MHAASSMRVWCCDEGGLFAKLPAASQINDYSRNQDLMPSVKGKHKEVILRDEDEEKKEKEEEDLGFFGHIMKKQYVKPSEEHLLARTEEDLANVLNVAFRVAEVKQIISPHSFSILANAEPQVELAAPVLAQAREVFRSNKDSVGGESLARKHIVPMLVSMGYDFDQSLMSKAVDRLAGSREHFSEDEWCALLEEYQAPAYHYGQILRKYCGRDELSGVEELLVRGCDVNSGDGEGLTPLHYAAELNRVRVINSLADLSRGRLRVDQQDKYGWSALHSAAHQGNTDAVQALLRLGADPACMDKYGKTPLHYAAAQVFTISPQLSASFAEWPWFYHRTVHRTSLPSVFW